MRLAHLNPVLQPISASNTDCQLKSLTISNVADPTHHKSPMGMQTAFGKMFDAAGRHRNVWLYVCIAFVCALALAFLGLAHEKRADDLYPFFDAPGRYAVQFDTGYGLNPLQTVAVNSTSGWNSIELPSSHGRLMLRTESGMRQFAPVEVQIAVQNAGNVYSEKYSLYQVKENAERLMITIKEEDQKEFMLGVVNCSECLILLSSTDQTLAYNIIDSIFEPTDQFFSSSLLRRISISGLGEASCTHACGVVAISRLGAPARVAFAEAHTVSIDGLITPARSIPRLLSQVVALMLMMLSITAPVLAAAGNVRSEERARMTTSLLVGLGFLAFLAFVYAILGAPAASWDHLVAMHSYRSDTVNGWYQWLYPILSGALEGLVGKNAVGYLNIALLMVSVVMVIFTTRRSSISLWAGMAVCFLLVLSGMGVLGPLHMRRDVTAALLVLVFLLTLYDREYNCPPNAGGLHLLAGFACMISAMSLRPDTFIVCGGVILLLGFARRRSAFSRFESLLRVTATLVAAVVGYIVISALLQFGFDRRSDEQKVLDRQFYAALTFMNGLGAALQDQNVSVDPACQEPLNAALDIQEFRQKWRPDFETYEMRNFNRNLDPPAFGAFVSCAFREIAKRPAAFLQGRLATLMGTLGGLDFLKPLRITKQDAHFSQRSEAVRYLNQAIYSEDEFTRGAYREFANRNGHVWLQLAVLVVALFCWKRAPLSGVIAAALFARLGFLLLAQPLTVFWYVFDVFLIGLFLPAMILFERSMHPRDVKHAQRPLPSKC